MIMKTDETEREEDRKEARKAASGSVRVLSKNQHRRLNSHDQSLISRQLTRDLILKNRLLTQLVYLAIKSAASLLKSAAIGIVYRNRALG